MLLDWKNKYFGDDKIFLKSAIFYNKFLSIRLISCLQTESVKDGMYFCDWTDADLKFKKLLLLSMRMNDADNKLTIKITPKRIVSMELFSSVNILIQHPALLNCDKLKSENTFSFQVIMTSYNIVSVMSNSRST